MIDIIKWFDEKVWKPYWIVLLLLGFCGVCVFLAMILFQWVSLEMLGIAWVIFASVVVFAVVGVLAWNKFISPLTMQAKKTLSKDEALKAILKMIADKGLIFEVNDMALESKSELSIRAGRETERTPRSLFLIIKSRDAKKKVPFAGICNRDDGEVTVLIKYRDEDLQEFSDRIMFTANDMALTPEQYVVTETPTTSIDPDTGERKIKMVKTKVPLQYIERKAEIEKEGDV